MRLRLAQLGALGSLSPFSPFSSFRALSRVFEANDREEPMDAVVRRFWSRTPPAAVAHAGAGGVVVDLARWKSARGHRVSP